MIIINSIDMKKLLLLSFYLLVFTFAWAQDTVYWCDFDHSSDTTGWRLANGNQTDCWTIGTAPNMNSGGLYITNTGDSNTFNPGSRSVVYAYRRVVLPRGAYQVSYDWRCMGGRLHSLDVAFLRVFLAPDLLQPVAGVAPTSPRISVPEGSIPLDGAGPLTNSSTWNTFVEDLYIPAADTFKLVLMWYNQSGANSWGMPAAVDNMLIIRPACPKPVWPYVEALTPTSFDLHWTDLSGGNATGCLVELDSATQTYGQGTLFTAYDTVISFTSLEPGTDYIVYLRAVCGGDTTDTVSLRIRTECLISSLPYVEDFGSAATSSLPTCWKRLVDNDEAYVSLGELRWVPHQAPYQCFLLPGIDTSVLSISSLQLTMQGMSRGDGVPFEVGVMTDPANPASFETVGRLNVMSTEWEQYVVDFYDYGGSGTYIAIRVADNAYGYRYSSTYFDDFVLDYAVCQPVRHLAVRHTGITGASVEWSMFEGNMSDPDYYEVRVERLDSVAAFSPSAPSDSCQRLICTEPHCILSGLTPNTNYRIWVRAHCPYVNMGVWDSVRLATRRLPCVAIDSSTIDMVSIGTDCSRVFGVPVSHLYVNSLCQSIYTADELRAQGMGAGFIEGMDYTFTTSGHDMTFSIYASTTQNEQYRNPPVLEPIEEQHLVYGPALYPVGTSGTVHYAFITPMEWDGVSNLVVTTIMNNASSVRQSAGFYGNSTRTDVNCTMYGYMVDSCFTLGNLSAGGYARSQYRPTVAFHMAECDVEAACAAPTVVVESVGADEAHVGWIAGIDEDHWALFYRLVGDTVWTVAAANIDTNYYHLVGLLPTSDYEVRVVPHCGNDSLYAQGTFATACAPISVLPWTTDFEDFEDMDYFALTGPCWYGAGNNYPRIRSNYAHSGSLSLYLSNNSIAQSHATIPLMDMDVDSLQVSFFAYAIGNADDYRYRLTVGVMDDPADISTFQAVATVSPSAPNVWEEKDVPLEGYTGNGRYITLLVEGSSNYVYVDDLTVDYLSPCRRPRNITVDRITRSTAVVQWDGHGVRNYEVEYGPAGFELGTGTVVATIYDSATLFGLSHSTRYDLYVHGICGDDTSAPSFVTTFSTICGEIESLPYIENFSHLGVDNGDRPTCWTCGGFDGRPYVIDGTDGQGRPHGQALYMPSDYYQRTYAILPAVDTAHYAVGSLQVVVKAHCAIYSDYYSHHLLFGVCQTEGDITSFTPLDTIELTLDPTVYVVPLTDAVGIGDYVTFVSTPMGGSYYNTIFLDSVVLMPIPSCQVPYGLSARVPSPTTATLTWTEGGSASQWQVEYMPQGTPLGTGTRIITATPSLTLTGLTPATSYDFYVRSVCSAGDTSEWCYTYGYFVTQQVPATVPYAYNVDSVSEWDSWQTLANTSIGWYRGMADGYPAPSIYLSADSGSTARINTGGVLNAVAYRDIDFGSADTSFIISFSAYVAWINSVGGLAVLLADPESVPVPLYNVMRQSPWGMLDTLALLAEVRGNTAWTDYSVTLDSIHGIRRLVFYAYGQNPSAGSVIGVDNINIQYAPCQRPYSIRAVNVTVASATVLWHGSLAADYRVRLYDIDDVLLANDTVHTNSIQYLTLVPSTTYKVRVGRLCDGSETEAAGTYVFTTPACTESLVDTVGNLAGTLSKVDVPLHLTYPYSYTQQIIRASELQGRGEITAINFLYDSPYNMLAKTNCTIYLGHTSINNFVTPNDYVLPDDLHAVYIGSLNCSQGWNRILLGSPFAYNGTDNLLIAIDDNSASNHYSQFHFATSVTDYPMTLSFFGYDNVDCSSAASLSLYTGGRAVRYYRSVLTVEMCPPNPCPPPRILEPRVGTSRVTLCWSNTARPSLFGYRRADSDRWLLDNVLVTDTFYTIDHFVYGDDYVYHLRQYCDTASISNWAIGSFNTAIIPCLPPLGLSVDSVTNNTAWLTWTPDDNHISYRLHVWGGGYDNIVTSYLARGGVGDLNPASRYYAAVQVQCEYVSQPSEWSDTISFATSSCPDATDLVAQEVHGNSVLLDWQCEEGVDEWLIEWGLQGFDQGSGITVTADRHPFLLTGLTGETTYDIAVRAVCGDDYVSENWSNRLTVTTQYSDINSVTDDPHVQLRPNPTGGDVQLTLPDGVGAVRVNVVDMAGRTLLSYSLSDHIDRANLSTSQMPQGAYYVQIVGDHLNAVKKLIKNGF